MYYSWQECNYGGNINSICVITTPGSTAHPAWTCCSSIQATFANWVSHENGAEPDGVDNYHSIFRFLNFNEFDFSGVVLKAKVGVDNVDPMVRCTPVGGVSDIVTGGSAFSYVSNLRT
jgi:hypothetical protein